MDEIIVNSGEEQLVVQAKDWSTIRELLSRSVGHPTVFRIDFLCLENSTLSWMSWRNFVPIVSEFFGIKIYMYWAEHFPMHFHAEYGDFKAIVSIQEAAIIKGMLPAKQLKLVLAWCEIHRDELNENWNSAQKNGKITKIEPLK